MDKSPIRELLQDKFTAIDIGARGDIPKHWLPLDGLAKIISFDADDEACKSLLEKYSSRGNEKMYEVHAVALGKADEKRTLHLTKGRGGSSLYKPDTEFIQEYVNSDYCNVEKAIEITTHHAGNYFNKIGITDADVLKIDIQGAELEVMKALPASLLSNILLIETEIQFHDRQNGAPIFPDIHQYLIKLGFELLDLNVIRHHPTTLGQRYKTIAPFHVAMDSPTIDRRIWYGDALYYRPNPMEQTKLHNLLISLCLYGFFTEAYRVIQHGKSQEIISATEENQLLDTIVNWHNKTRYHWRFGHSKIARFTRWLLGYLNLEERLSSRWFA